MNGSQVTLFEKALAEYCQAKNTIEKSTENCYPSPMKRCTKCGEDKELGEFTKQAKGRFGVGCTCRLCRSAYNKARVRNPERERETQRRYKERHRERLLLRAAELRAANPERFRLSLARYRAKNREALNVKARAKMAKHRAEHPEKDKAACARYYATHREQHRERGKQWVNANREKSRLLGAAKQARHRAKDRERSRTLATDWRRRNQDKMQAYAEGRRARKMQAPGNGVTVPQWRSVRMAAIALCSYCNERRPLTMDHIEPLVFGGAHDIINVVAVCGKCNQSKGTKSLLHWLVRRSLERAA